jgi:serine/threonine-protein kinase
MLYECATGRRPFTAASQYDLMHAIVTGPVIAPSALTPPLPMAFDTLVLRAMSREPGRRYSSVRALGSALLSFADKPTWVRWRDEFTGGMDSSDANKVVPEGTERDAPRPSAGVTLAPPPQPRRSHNALAAAVLGALVIAGAGLFAITGARDSASRSPSTANALPPAPALAPVTPAPLPVMPAAAAAPAPAEVRSPPRPQADSVPPAPLNAPSASPAAARMRRETKPPKRVASSPTASSRPKNEELGDDDVFDPFPPR